MNGNPRAILCVCNDEGCTLCVPVSTGHGGEQGPDAVDVEVESLQGQLADARAALNSEMLANRGILKDMHDCCARSQRAEAELERLGFRRCDVAACNCGGYHQHRPTQIESSLEKQRDAVMKERDHWRDEHEKRRGEALAAIMAEKSAQDRAEKSEALAERLAGDALAALSGVGIPTPHAGYAAEPFCLRSDILRLARQRDEARDAANESRCMAIDAAHAMDAAEERLDEFGHGLPLLEGIEQAMVALGSRRAELEAVNRENSALSQMVRDMAAAFSSAQETGAEKERARCRAIVLRHLGAEWVGNRVLAEIDGGGK